jgi:hypothetical protein
MRYKDGVSTLSGVEIINHFNLSSSEIDTFFNVFCLDLEIVMTINPGYDECSPDWRLNNYGLTESYFKQALRQVKIKELGI